MGLAVIHPAIYRHLAASAPAQFARWAREVWDVAEKNDLAAAMAGIDALAAFSPDFWSAVNRPSTCGCLHLRR